MHLFQLRIPASIAVVSLSLAFTSGAYAYGTEDAVRDCESRLRSEYSLSDFRDQSAEQLMDSEHHYKVKGNTKIDDKKHPFGCEISNRHVTSVSYSGPKPEGMGTAEKLAIGAAAAIAAGLVASELSKDDDSKTSDESSASDECPADIKGNECEYYKDGYRAGTEDGKASMSMAYERHADDYDSRFEPYYERGYEAGWKANR